ncbi:MAG TPA: HAMP domain-containing protein, partial [Patescibacteria group bacterium]|nr:HAMP domain-containing protein [Patescibacteria group bacterium]
MKLISKIIIPFVAFAVLLLAFIVVFARQSLRGALFRNEFYAIQESVASEAATHLRASDFDDPKSADAAQHFLAFAEGVTDSTTARVTIWNKDSEIVYSDLASIIGTRSAGRPGLIETLASGKASFHEQKKDDEKPVQTDVGEFLDIYVPVSFAGKLAGAVEVHSVIGAVLLPIQRQVNDISLLLIVGTLLFVGVLYLVAQLFIGRPFKKIDAFVDEVEHGRFGARVDIRAKDEVGQLGRELNRMAVGLQRLQELKNEFVFIASHELRS